MKFNKLVKTLLEAHEEHIIDISNLPDDEYDTLSGRTVDKIFSDDFLDGI